MATSITRRVPLSLLGAAVAVLGVLSIADVGARQGAAQGPGVPARPPATAREGAPPTGTAAGRQGGALAQSLANVDVKVLPVQGNVYMAVGGFVNAAFSVGDDGVIVVDTMMEPLADKLVEAIRAVAGNKPIRYIINTHVHPDHTGGNAKVASTGRSIVGGNFAAQVGAAASQAAFIWAHENVLTRLARPEPGQPESPTAAWPTDTYINDARELFFNGEAVQVLHQPNAHTDGDSMVFFRKSDVVVAGDVFLTTGFPIINLAQGASFDGIIASLNRLIDITVPREKQEGGTYVIPGHGRLTDEADVVDYRDMVTIIRDRLQDAIKKGQTLEQVKAARLLRDYEGRYGATEGFWTTDAFLDAAYQSLRQPVSATAKSE